MFTKKDIERIKAQVKNGKNCLEAIKELKEVKEYSASRKEKTKCFEGFYYDKNSIIV